MDDTTNREIIGHCDGCDSAILNGGDFRRDDEGLLFCWACVQADEVAAEREYERALDEAIAAHDEHLATAWPDDDRAGEPW